MRIGANARKLLTAGAFVLLVAGAWVGLALIPERSPEERKQIADLFDHAETSEAKGRLADAEAAYREALGLAERVRDLKAQIAGRIGLARLAAAHERHGEAVEYLIPALDLARGLKDPERTATVLNNLGEVSRIQGNLEEAKRRFQEALDLPGATEKTRAAALNNLGEIARADRRFDEALNYYRRSMVLNEQIDYRPGLAANLANIGSIHLVKGQTATGIAWLERGQRAAFEAGDRLAVPAILTTLGQAYLAAGRIKDGMWSLVEARDQYLLLGLEAKAAALTSQIRAAGGGDAAPRPGDRMPARTGTER